MKKDLHPPYFPRAIIHCACGNTIVTGSSKEKLEVEICSHCHPVYTGKEKLVDTAGRVDRFRKRLSKAAAPKSGPKRNRKIRK